MKNLPLLLAAATLICGGWAIAKKPTKAPDPTGLRTVPVTSDKNTVVPKTAFVGDKPGENRNYERSYHTAPPMIPHTVDIYLPITTRNECLKCHLNPPRDLVKKQIPVVPKSHFMDRNGKDVGGKLASVRNIYAGFWNCSMCHAPQADAKPLVDNAFKRDQ